jgi:hypothetical protein
VGSDGRAGAICANGSVETLAGCWAEWRARVQCRAGSARSAICSAEMRRQSGADKHKENNGQGGVWWEASYQTAGVGGGGRGRCSVVQGGWCWRLLEVRGARSVGLLLAAGERARERLTGSTGSEAHRVVGIRNSAHPGASDSLWSGQSINILICAGPPVSPHGV